MDKKNKLLTRITAVRRDLGSMLFHFTRKIPADDGMLTLEDPTPEVPARKILMKILEEGKLIGSSKKIKGGHKCICFTEAPITEMAAIFNLVKFVPENEPKPLLYEPFGIAISKEWLFKQGGRPVIYQPADEYDSLPVDLQYRHVSFDPCNGPDFTWEREWRINADFLQLNKDETLVIVPEASEAYIIAYEHSDIETEYDRDGSAEGGWHRPSWLTVSLDFFGLDD